MGTFNCPLRLESMDGERSLEIEALVDTGAFYTMVPASQLTELGVTPSRSVHLELADGRVGEYDLGEARATIDGRSVTTIVVFGEEGVEPLLGSYTLEGLGLVVDPWDTKLFPRTFREIRHL